MPFNDPFKVSIPKVKENTLGEVGYDNPRENIDPHQKTKAIETKEINTQKGNISETPSVGDSITNKTYVDSQISGENHWDMTGNYVETYVDNKTISGAGLAISGSTFTVDKSTGNVGIGTSPSYLLEVAGQADNNWIAQIQNTEATDGRNYGFRVRGGSTSADKAFAVEDHDGANSLFSIGGDGKVGIGTTSPDWIFDVHDSSGNAYLGIGRATQSQGSSGLYIQGGTSGINWSIYQPANSDNLRFHNGTTDVVTIEESGNVGIGTASPKALLQVDGGRIFVAGGTGAPPASGRGIEILHTGTQGQIYAYNRDTPGYDDLFLGSGNVGIGTTAPQTKFDLRDGSLGISNSNVDHGITDYAPTNTYTQISPIIGSQGGALIAGFTDLNNSAVQLIGYQGTGSGSSAVSIFGRLKSGTSYTRIGNTDTVFAVGNAATEQFSIDGGGVLNIVENTQHPVTNPSGEGKLFVSGGALIYLGTSGTTTVLGAA